MAKHKFIKKATENAHGQFKAKAEKAGKATRQYAVEKSDAPGKLGEEARLAETLMKMHPKSKKAERRYAPKAVSH
jgi:hypothetical protein